MKWNSCEQACVSMSLLNCYKELPSVVVSYFQLEGLCYTYQKKDQNYMLNLWLKLFDIFVFSVIVIGCSVAGIAGLALAGYCWYK